MPERLRDSANHCPACLARKQFLLKDRNPVVVAVLILRARVRRDRVVQEVHKVVLVLDCFI